MVYSTKFNYPIRVAVILSLYNGMEFIEEQIKSILLQNLTKNVNLKLFIRNDEPNSDIKTQCFLKKMQLVENIEILPDSGENLGVQNSFLRLLNFADADYYFFSDQDDLWEKNKVSKFLTKFQETETETKGSILIYSDMQLIDRNIKKIDVEYGSIVGDRTKNSISERLFYDTVTGASMAINRKLRDLAIRINPSDFQTVTMHDSAISQLAALSGRIVYIPHKLILYRQHDNNTLGIKVQHFSRFSFANLYKKFRWYKRHLNQANLMMSILDNSEIEITNTKLIRALGMFNNQRFIDKFKNGMYISKYVRGYLNKIMVVFVTLINRREHRKQ